METRQHVHEEILAAPVETVFALLHTPSAIRDWWGAARAVVLAEAGGTWAAAWGEDEDRPDYITTATIKVFEPSHRMVLTNFRYFAKDGPLPFDAEFELEFLVAPHADGATLRVTQDGFPAASEADEYYAACQTGWTDTFAGVRRHLESRKTES